MFGLLFIFLPVIRGFNIDIDHPIVLLGGEDSLFGFRIALNISQAYIGAPEQGKQGKVYRCDFDGSLYEDQRVLCNDIARRDSISLAQEKQWMGSSLAIHKADLYACAPRTFGLRLQDMKANMGTCYKYDQRSRLEFDPLFNHQLPHRNEGWETASVMNNELIVDEEGSLIYGIPLSRPNGFDWKHERMSGSISKFEPSTESLLFPPASRSIWAENSKASTKNDPHSHDLTGSAIARGRFFKNGNNSDLAIGSPKSNGLTGRVYVCFECFSSNPSSVDDKLINGEQFGSRFGQTVAAVDVNGDGFHDLLVGAPLHAYRPGYYETGMVYLYQTNAKGLQTDFILERKIALETNELQSKARFGASIAGLGDLDRDGLEDFAVGAPFHEAGAVYVFYGNERFDIKGYSQKLTPRELQRPELRGFGWSLSFGQDLDNNGFNDFAIGAPLSGKAVIVRAKEVVRIQPMSYKIFPKTVKPSDGEFLVQVCTQLKDRLRKTVRPTIRLDKMDKRIRQTNKEWTLDIPRGSRTQCQEIRIVANVDNFGVTVDDNQDSPQLPSPIRFNAVIDWAISPLELRNCPRLGCPMEDPRVQLNETLLFNVDLLSGCENPEECRCHLKLLSHEERTFTAVKGKDFVYNFGIDNTGSEPSFGIEALIQMPHDLQVRTQDGQNCENVTLAHQSEGQVRQRGDVEMAKSHYTMKCDLKSMKAFHKKYFELLIDSTYFNFQSMQFDIKLSDFCYGQDTHSPELSQTVDLLIDYDYDLHLSPVHAEERQDFKYDANGVTFKQTFRITNQGVSPTFDAIPFRLYLPIDDRITAKDPTFSPPEMTCDTYEIGPSSLRMPQTSSADEVISCSTTGCQVYDCSVAFVKGMFPEEDVVEFTFDLQFMATKEGESRSFDFLTHMQMDERTTFEHAYFYSNEYSEGKLLIQTLPIIIGSIIGLIILIVIIVVLWKTGKFSEWRIFKKKLDDAEKLGAPADQPAAE